MAAKSAGYNKTLTDIGAASSFDPTKLSSATVESMVSHVNLLRRNGVQISKSALTADPARLLDTLVTTKNKKLAPLYKLQIAATLRRMYPDDISVDLRKYTRTRVSKVSRVSSQPFMRAMRRIVDAASAVLRQVYVEREIGDLAKYDTALVVLLSSCTSMRVSELYQLKTTDIDTIRRHEPVVVRSKGARGGKRRVVSPNDLLLTVLDAVQSQREAAVRAANESPANNRSPHYKAQRVAANYILLTSISHMRRTLKELAAAFGVSVADTTAATQNDPDGHTMGFNAFRKYITTLLVDGGGHAVAQAINNHTSLNTTLTNYHVQGAQSAQSTYERIDSLMAQHGRSAGPSDTRRRGADTEQRPRPRTTPPPSSPLPPLSSPSVASASHESVVFEDASGDGGGDDNNDDDEEAEEDQDVEMPEYAFPPTPMTPGNDYDK